MEFLKKRAEYVSVLPIKKAATELRKDRRIKKVVCVGENLTIYTKPIIPINDEDDILPYPIGEYVIDISYDGGDFYPDIKRLGRELEIRKSLHIFRSGSVCWGNAEDEIETISENEDWLWFVKRLLDVMEDGFDEEIGELRPIYRLQIEYAKRNGPKKIIPRLEESYSDWETKCYEYG